MDETNDTMEPAAPEIPAPAPEPKKKRAPRKKATGDTHPRLPDEPMQQTPIVEPTRAEVKGDVPDRPVCVGMPVQFQGERGPIPGVLQRQCITDPGLYDVKISLDGAGVWLTRPAVRYSATPRPGCWNFLPI